MRKKKGIIRELFGISQQDIAALLKISRAQWSMYESGKRSLPFEAKKQFALLLSHMQSAKQAEKKQTPLSIPPNKKTIQKLESSLLANQHRQFLTANKITSLQKKRDMGAAALYLEGFFENHKDGQPNYMEGYIHSILKRAEKDSQLGVSAEMIALEIKLKTLCYEEKLLKEELKKNTSTSPSCYPLPS